MFWGKKNKDKKKKTSKKTKKKTTKKTKSKAPKKVQKSPVKKKKNQWEGSIKPKKKVKKIPVKNVPPDVPLHKEYSGETILLRCRGKDGMFRIKVKTDMPMVEVKKGVMENNRVDYTHIDIYLDLRCTQVVLNDRTVSHYRLRNGSMIYYKYSEKITSRQEAEAEKVREKKKLIGDGSDLNNLGLRFKKKHWTMNEYLAHLDKTTIKIKSQKNAVCKSVHVDQFSAQEFHNYLNNTAFQQQRCAWLIGTTKKLKNEDDEDEEEGEYETDTESDSDEEELTWEQKQEKIAEQKKLKYIDTTEWDYKDVYVDAMYEPDQIGDSSGFVLKKDPFIDAVDKVSACLNRSRVGFIFSYIGKRKVPFTGAELLRAAKMQDENGEHFVTISMTINEKHAVQFEAFQVSKLCVDLYKRGFLKEHPEDKFKVALKKPVNYSGKIVSEVDCIIFMVNVAIKDFVSEFMVQNGFPQRHRKGSNQTIGEMKKVLGRRRNLPYYQQLMDFNLLFYLTNILSVKTDFPRLCEGMLTKSDRKLSSFKELLNAYMAQ